jgi:hypothetical protein
MGYRYKFRVGQTVKVKLAGDEYYGKIGRVLQQHHARNVIEFPNGDKHDYLDSELRNA